MLCRLCNTSNPDSNLRCYQCGAPLATEKPSSSLARPAKGGGKSSGKGSPSKSISMDHSRTVAHVPKKKRKRVLKIDPNFDPKLRYKSIKKKTAKKGPAKRGARK